MGQLIKIDFKKSKKRQHDAYTQVFLTRSTMRKKLNSEKNTEIVEEQFDDRLERIKYSLGKINTLMRQLKSMEKPKKGKTK